MRLMLLKGRGGSSLRPRWYGRASIRGRLRTVPLCMWKGTPPPTGRVTDQGDRAFEASRVKAMAELREAVEGERSKADEAALSERVHRARYGRKVKEYRVKDMPRLWCDIPRRRKPSDFHQTNMLRVIGRFVEYMADHAPAVEELGAVEASHASGFIEGREAEGVSGRTLNVEISVLRGMFKRYAPFSSAFREYLADCPMREENTIHRTPFTSAELNRIMQEAADDDFLRPLIVCAICSAMRRGDVCRLRWGAVDLARGMLRVKTAKTGADVQIPILPPLRRELEMARAALPRKPEPDASAFVWPPAARMIADTPDMLDRLLKSVLVRAGLVAPQKKSAENQKELEELDPRELQRRIQKAIRGARGWSQKRRHKTEEICSAYLAGRSLKAVAARLGLSVGLVSTRLSQMQTITGARIVRRTASAPVADTLAPKSPDVQRLKCGSTRGWHSFRTGWITAALAAGVPVELVRRVSGHTAVDVILRHYLRPNEAQLKEAIAAPMARALALDDHNPPQADAGSSADDRTEIRNALPAHLRKRFDRIMDETAAGIGG